MIKQIIKFTSSECFPCKVLTETLNKSKYKDMIKSYIVEEDEGYIESLSFKVKSVPTLIFLNENLEEVERTHGNIPLKQIEEIINKYDKSN